MGSFCDGTGSAAQGSVMTYRGGMGECDGGGWEGGSKGWDYVYLWLVAGLPWWLSDDESACNSGDTGLIPGLGRSLGEGNDNPLQYSCLENFMDGGAWWATAPKVAKSQARLKRLRMHP